MFTFGREHEIEQATCFIGDTQKAEPLLRVINLVHDQIEGAENQAEVVEAIKFAISEGPSGVWESAGSWLKKLSVENGEYAQVWLQLASHQHSKVRFRVASFIGEIPSPVGEEVSELLSNDASNKVREHAAGKINSANGLYQ